MQCWTLCSSVCGGKTFTFPSGSLGTESKRVYGNIFNDYGSNQKEKERNCLG